MYYKDVRRISEVLGKRRNLSTGLELTTTFCGMSIVHTLQLGKRLHTGNRLSPLRLGEGLLPERSFKLRLLLIGEFLAPRYLFLKIGLGRELSPP